MMEDWRENLLTATIKSRIQMYQIMLEADEKDIQWAKDHELPELENWFVGRTKGYTSAQDTLRDILRLLPGEAEA